MVSWRCPRPTILLNLSEILLLKWLIKDDDDDDTCSRFPCHIDTSKVVYTNLFEGLEN